jgi:hypothetical protein
MTEHNERAEADQADVERVLRSVPDGRDRETRRSQPHPLMTPVEETFGQARNAGRILRDQWAEHNDGATVPWKAAKDYADAVADGVRRQVIDEATKK